jgi:ubiquinone/menaquinone biosynthesis C-methylase UbiE
MIMEFRNTYEDATYADAYSRLEFPGTYHLAFRDLPDIFAAHVKGRRALDIGCGTGRSTRFLRELGFEAVGVDISEEMIVRARAIDPTGDYRLIAAGDLRQFAYGEFDLVFSAFTFDNVPTAGKKIALFAEMGRVLKARGRIVNLVCSQEMYTHEWVSFSTRDFPENREAKCGDQVLIINKAIGDPRPAVDILWPDEDYREVYRRAGLEVVEVFRPLGRDGEPFEWVSETKIAPWVIYILRRA